MAFMTGYGPCYGCGRVFPFNPERVPSIVPPRLGRIYMLGLTSTMIKLGDGDYRDREPICRDCVEHSNRRRPAMGLSPIKIHPDAYEGQEVAY